MEPQDKMSEYIGLFEAVRAKVGNEAIAIAIVDQIGRDRRVEAMNAERANGRAPRQIRDPEAPATERQRALLDKLGVIVAPERLTKAVASRLIDQAKQEPAAS